MRWFDSSRSLQNREIRMKIFVFGSNEAGIHGAGAAKSAREQHGAIYGNGRGIQGNSYGIPTKDHRLKVRKLVDIMEDVEIFIQFAKDHPEHEGRDHTFFTRMKRSLTAR